MRAAGALAIVPVALTACGGGSATHVSPARALAQAAEKTRGEDTAEVEYTVGGGTVEGSGRGVFDNASGEGRLALTATASGQSIRMQELMTSNHVMYISSPIFAARLGGKKWLKIDLQKAGTTMGIDFSSLSGARPADAIAGLNAAGNVKEAGEEEVAGVDTTHYKATVNLERAAQSSDAQRAKSLRRIEQLTGTKTIPVEVWIDHDGLVRRFRESYAVSGQTLTTTMTITKFGVPVNVQAPPDSEVLDASTMTR